MKDIITVNYINADNYKEYIDKCVNVTGSVVLCSLGLKEIPIKFCKVEGDFDCSNNFLTSLEGAPKEVGGMFICSNNLLTSLEGAPELVCGNFNCYFNKLTSLDGAPKEVGDDFICFDNIKKFTKADVRKVSDVKGKINNK